MASHQRVPLHQLVPGMSDTDPDDGLELFKADPATLSDAARALRQHIADAVKGTSRPVLSGPGVVRDVLRRGLLQPKSDRWTLYALGPDRRTVQVPGKGGGTWNLSVPASKVPDPDELPPLPRGGQWLVIWGGSVDTLSIEGVPNRLLRLQRGVPVADIIFYDRSLADGEPTLFSVKLGRGACGSKRVEFPNPTALSLARGRRNDT